MLNEFAEYYGWADAGKYMNDGNFSAWLTYTGKIRIPILVLPMIVTTIFALLLIKHLPPQVPRWTLWLVLTCRAVAWVSTFVFQVPLEMQLSKNGFDVDVMQRLLITDWLRKAAFFIEITVVLYIISRVIRSFVITAKTYSLEPL